MLRRRTKGLAAASTGRASDGAMAGDEGPDSSGATPIGQIPLRRVSRASLGADNTATDASANPMNRLVPFLDLFCRLTDTELSRLSGVPPETTGQLRKQVDAVCDALARYVDLLPRLADPELMRLTGASAKTIRFWRLCQPRVPEPLAEATEQARRIRTTEASAVPTPVKQATTSAMPVATDVTGKYSVTSSTERVAPVPASPSPPRPGAGPVPPARVAPLPGSARPVRTPVPPPPPPLAKRGVAAPPAPQKPAESTPAPPAGRPPSAPRPAAGSDLGLSGAPFPGYDYDPNEAAALDKDEDGIFIRLELPD